MEYDNEMSMGGNEFHSLTMRVKYICLWILVFGVVIFLSLGLVDDLVLPRLNSI